MLLEPELEIPVVVDPVKMMDGVPMAPVGICKAPVMVSPVFKTFKEEAPVTLAVMMSAAKFPDASRATIKFAVAAAVAVVAELLTLPAVAMVASLVSTMAAEAEMSALTIKEDDTRPVVTATCKIPAAAV